MGRRPLTASTIPGHLAASVSWAEWPAEGLLTYLRTTGWLIVRLRITFLGKRKGEKEEEK